MKLQKNIGVLLTKAHLVTRRYIYTSLRQFFLSLLGVSAKATTLLQASLNICYSTQVNISKNLNLLQHRSGNQKFPAVIQKNET
jgi:hypothetical protein